MSNRQVIVVARFTAKKGLEERVKQELLAMIAPTRAEEALCNSSTMSKLEKITR